MERDWQPIVLQSKEGLAFTQWNQFMSAYGMHILMKANKFSYLADLIGTISLEV
jgi:histidine ammonia-lyase